MDIVALAQNGIDDAVATLGTATNSTHLTRLFRMVSEVIYCFDGDNAGRTAAWRGLQTALPVLEDGRQVRFLFLPEGEDPDTLVRKIGKDRFNDLIDHATPLADFFFRQGLNVSIGAIGSRRVWIILIVTVVSHRRILAISSTSSILNTGTMLLLCMVAMPISLVPV
jgi:DNA primase